MFNAMPDRLRTKSDCETVLDCATMLEKLFREIAQLGLRNYAAATLSLYFATAFHCLAQLISSYCATIFVVLSNYFRCLEQLFSLHCPTTAILGR